MIFTWPENPISFQLSPLTRSVSGHSDRGTFYAKPPINYTAYGASYYHGRLAVSIFPLPKLHHLLRHTNFPNRAPVPRFIANDTNDFVTIYHASSRAWYTPRVLRSFCSPVLRDDGSSSSRSPIANSPDRYYLPQQQSFSSRKGISQKFSEENADGRGPEIQ